MDWIGSSSVRAGDRIEGILGDETVPEEGTRHGDGDRSSLAS